jgi:hypothetical protein
MKASKINLMSPELAQIVSVGVEEVPALVGVAGGRCRTLSSCWNLARSRRRRPSLRRWGLQGRRVCFNGGSCSDVVLG